MDFIMFNQYKGALLWLRIILQTQATLLMSIQTQQMQHHQARIQAKMQVRMHLKILQRIQAIMQTTKQTAINICDKVNYHKADCCTMQPGIAPGCFCSIIENFVSYDMK